MGARSSPRAIWRAAARSGCSSASVIVSFGRARRQATPRTARRARPATRCGSIAEQLGQTVVQHAAGAQPAGVGGVLIAAAAAHGWRARRRNRGRPAPRGRGSASAGVSGRTPDSSPWRQRAPVAAAADRPFGPVRRRASRAAAVRACLRPTGAHDAAQHPPAALAAARPHLPAVLARDGRSGPADRAQVRVAVDGETHDRAHPPAAAAGPDRPLVATLAPRAALAVRPAVNSPHASHGSGEPVAQCEHCAGSPAAGIAAGSPHVAHVVCGRSRARRADPLPGPVGCGSRRTPRSAATGLM